VPNVISTTWVIAALVIFLAKHLAADFLLQTAWMANGKEQPSGWFFPLLAHVLNRLLDRLLKPLLNNASGVH